MSEGKNANHIEFLGCHPLMSEEDREKERKEALEIIKKQFQLLGMSEKEIQEIFEFFASKTQRSSNPDSG